MDVAHHIAVLACPEAAGHNHFAVFVQGFANRIQRFRHRRVNKAAGVDHNQIRPFVAGRNLVPFGTQAGQDVFRVNQCLGAAKRDKTDAGDVHRDKA